MPVSEIKQSAFQQEYMQHAEELLCHTSRYYAYTEQFLANLSGQSNFSMTGYHANHLSKDQLRLLATLMMEEPTQQNGQVITQIISDVIRGEANVDKPLLEQFCKHSPSQSYLLHHYYGGHGFQLDQIDSPAGPIKEIAERLLIPIHIENNCAKLPFNQLGGYLDSSNPTIRQNILESIQRLYAGGYKLVNQSNRPTWHIDLSWNRLRISRQLMHSRLTRGFHFTGAEHAGHNTTYQEQ
jgi:hypothetical protein